uniref:Uncharacterized protein n=1 Tax=Anopheles culicifacies TaxID=139723 RepID=A0A182LRC6_9DIPT
MAISLLLHEVHASKAGSIVDKSSTLLKIVDPIEADVEETVTSPATDEVDTAEDPPEDEVADETSELSLPFALPPDLLVEKECISASVILAQKITITTTTNTANGPSSPTELLKPPPQSVNLHPQAPETITVEEFTDYNCGSQGNNSLFQNKGQVMASTYHGITVGR